MCIAHTAKIMFSEFLSCSRCGGVSGKVHSELIVAIKVLMPVGGGGEVHYEHILATSTRYAIDIRIAFLYHLFYKPGEPCSHRSPLPRSGTTTNSKLHVNPMKCHHFHSDLSLWCIKFLLPENCLDQINFKKKFSYREIQTLFWANCSSYLH